MRKKGSILGFIFLLFIGFSYVVPDVSQAVPAFARQTGLSCTTCHFQHFSSLNAFGRAFKSGGFTMVGGQSMVEGNMLSLPSTLNASMVLKVRYQKTNGDSSAGKDLGQLQFPDEAALFLGGRAGENIGFILEGQMADPDAPFMASFKMPFVYDIAGHKFSVIPFSTDGLGAAFGFELLNTGAVRNIRTLEHRSEISAQQFIGTDGAAEGIAFVAASNMGFVNATLWTPDQGTLAVNSPAYYLRFAATPQMGGMDLGAGFQYWGGSVSRDAAAGGDVDTRAMALDAQAQGAVGSMPLGVYFTYASAEKSTSSVDNLFNSNSQDESAWTILAELGILPNKATVAFGYRNGDTGAATKNESNAMTLGATYQVEQNVQLQLNYSSYSGNKYDPKPAIGGDQQTTLMLFTSF